MAIAAAAAAARAPLPEVRMAYLLMAESWSDLAKAEDAAIAAADSGNTAIPKENRRTDIRH